MQLDGTIKTFMQICSYTEVRRSDDGRGVDICMVLDNEKFPLKLSLPDDFIKLCEENGVLDMTVNRMITEHIVASITQNDLFFTNGGTLKEQSRYLEYLNRGSYHGAN